MKKLDIKKVSDFPTCFRDGLYVFEKGLSTDICETNIKTEFCISEVRKLDKGEAVIKTQKSSPPFSKRLGYLKATTHFSGSDLFYTIPYEETERDFTEEVKKTLPKLIHGELWDTEESKNTS